MKPYLYIINHCDVRIWGLTPGERFKRILGPGLTEIKSLEDLPKDATIIITRGDYLVDDRLVKYLAATPGIIVLNNREGEQLPFCAHVAASDAQQTVSFIRSLGKTDRPQGPEVKEIEELPVSFNRRLRKHEPPFVFKAEPGREDELEKKLFNWSYKGVTDLVTKWLWPKPACRVVKQCVKLGLRPNHVTLIGFILVVLAGWLFYQGQLFLGLLCGWLMTFLDTVDGKLARVTVTSSKFGHYFDHLIDLVHPPFWYLLWGMGLQATGRYGIDTPLSHLMWWLFSAYIIGRLVEGTFKWTLGSFGIFCWRPIDSFFRLVTARRNPCMIFLTVSLLFGRPDVGLLAVVGWSVFTTAFLLGRLAYGFYLRFIKGETLESWFSTVDERDRKSSLAVRWFTRKPEV